MTRLLLIHFSRRKFLTLLGAALAIPVRAAQKGTPPKPQNVLSPDQALDRLMQGNRRYVDGNMRRHDFITERPALALGQNPFAGVLSCADHGLGLNTPSIPGAETFSFAG